MNPTITVAKANITENPDIANPKINSIGKRKVMVVSNPNFNLLATTKYNMIARTPARTASPTISFTKIHLKSNKSHVGILVFSPHPLDEDEYEYDNNWCEY